MQIDKTWMVHAKRADFKALADRFGIDQVIARIIINRGVEEDRIEGFLHPQKRLLNDPGLLEDTDRACEIIKSGIESGKRIRIIGDYDIDGICSTYILKQSLLYLGADVDYYLPRRIEDGYGMNEKMVRDAMEQGIEIIITCDNGISASGAVSLAKELGMQIVVTDHHEVPKDADGADKLVPADAVIDPKRSDCNYPFKEICGAVVAWKFCLSLCKAMGKSDEPVMDMMEFAAFATVGDIMQLTDENRAIVSMGLKKMGHTKNIGLGMLVEACGLNGVAINAYHIGFVLGPCLNAGGRLADARMGVELFECTDRERAYEIALELKALNDRRKDMTLIATNKAIEVIEQNGYDKQDVIVVYVPGVHESLCGIIAGRIKERYNRPAFMLTDSTDHVKGSGRSIESYSMFEKISECGHLFTVFGGHPMAAGLSIPLENVDSMRTELNARAGLSTEELKEKVMIDVPMPISYISYDLINQLDLLEPFGNGNPKPVFAAKDVFVHRMQRIGKSGEYLKLSLKSGENYIDGLCYADADRFEEEIRPGEKINIIYYPQINEYRGNRSLQVVIKDFRKS